MSKQTPLQVGITGGIGSGKSVVARVFAVLHVPVYDADSRAKWIMSHDPVLKADLLKAFGPDTYSDSGALNRTYLAATVFNDPDKVTLLNSLVHPQVGADYSRWVQQHDQYSYLIKEAALLFESGSYQALNHIIAVHAPVAVRMQRVLRRDSHRTEADVKAIMARQMNEDEKLVRADYVLYNDESRLVIEQVLALDQVFRSRA